MRDDQGSAAFHHFRKRVADAKFGVGVDAGGRFIEDQKARAMRQRAGETDELFLAGGESVAALAHRLRESCGKGAHEVQ